MERDQKRSRMGIKEHDQGWGLRNNINGIKLNDWDRSVALRVFIKDPGQRSGSKGRNGSKLQGRTKVPNCNVPISYLGICSSPT